MANCKDLHKEGSDEYKACIEKNKIEEEKNIEEREEKVFQLDEVTVTAPKKEIPIIEKNAEGLEIIKEEKLEINKNTGYSQNELPDFEDEVNSDGFWQGLGNYLKLPTAAKIVMLPLYDNLAVEITQKQNKDKLEAIKLDINGLDALNLDGDILPLSEDTVGYDPTFKTIGQSLSTVNILELEDYESKILTDLAAENLVLQHEKSADFKSDFEPTTWDVFFETLRIFNRSTPYFEKDNTPIDAIATKKGMDKNSWFINMMSDFWKAGRSGLLRSQTIEPLNDMIYGDGEEKSKGFGEYMKVNAKQLKLNSTSQACKKYEARIKELGGGAWATLTAVSENLECAFSMAIESSALNAGNFINSDTARENAVNNAKQVTTLSVLSGLRNPYAIGAALTGSFLAGGIQIMERSLTAHGILADELAKPENGGIDISQLTEEKFFDLLEDKEFMEDLLRKSENRGTVTNATILLATWASYATASGLRKRGATILQTLLTTGLVGVSTEITGEIARIAAEEKAPFSKEGQRQFIEEGVLGPLSPGNVVGTTTALLQGTHQNIIAKNATDIAKNSMFPNLFDVFKKQTATGVEIIKTGFTFQQLKRYLNGLKFNNKISKAEQTNLEENFQNLQKNVSSLKNISKEMNLSNEDIAYLSDLLTKISANNKIIKSFSKEAPGMSIKFQKENDILNDELAAFFEGKTKMTTEGIALNEVVVKPKVKKEQDKRGQKIDDLAGKRKDNGQYEITKEEWDNGGADKAITDIFTQPDPITKKPGLLNSVIASKITFQMSQLPNFSPEDFISATVLELIPHIRGFNPEINDSLNGWIIPQIQNKVKNALKKGKSGTKEKFESSIQSGSVDGKEIQIEDNTTQENIDIEAQVLPAKVVGDLIASIVGIDSETTAAAANQTIRSRIPIKEKGNQNPALKSVSDIGKAKFYEMIMEAFGGPLGVKENKIGNFTTFLEANGVNILKVLEFQHAIKNNQLAGLYGPKKVGRTTGKFDKGAGKGVFEYDNPNPTVQDLITFLTDPNTGMTTLRNRQEKFADILAGLLNRAKTKELLETKQGAKVGQDSQKIVNPSIPDAVAKILGQIDVVVAKLDTVGKNQLGSGVSPALIANLLSGGLKLLKSGIKGSVSLAQALGRLKRYITDKAKNSELADVITRYFVDKATTGKINEINESSIGQILTEFAVVTGNVNVLLTKHKQAKTYDLKSKTSIKNYIADIKKNLLPLMPRYFWFGTTDKNGQFGTQFTGSSKLIGVSITDKKLYKFFEKEIKKLNNDNQEFGPPILDKEGKEIDFSVGGYSTLFGTPGKARLNIGNNKIADFNKKIGLIHRELWKRTFTAIKDNPKQATVIANYMKGVGSNTRHWHKMGAQFAGYSNVMTDGVVFEHAMPATAAYIYLLDAALSGKDFNTEYNNIIKNYKLIALSKKNDNKINKVVYDGKAWLKTRMNPGWLVETGKWYDRYFNNLVAAVNGGIDPNSIIMLDGRTLAETFDIQTSQGRPEAIIAEANNKSADKIAEGQNAIKNDPDLIPKQPKDLDKEFNIILQDTKGVNVNKRYSDIGARKAGRNKGKYKFFMPPGAQDFELLIYNFLTKGLKGEKQKKFFENNLIKPYSKGIAKMENYRAQLKNDFEALKKLMPKVNKKLGNKIKGLDYTNSQAIRVFLWDKSGFDIPGISKTDKNKLIAHVNKNPDLIQFTEGLTALSKQPTWVKPTAYWDTGSLVKDINDLAGVVGRGKYLQQFVTNAGLIFSTKNLNKIEATYGIELREAIEDILYRMKNGTNRPVRSDRLTNSFTTWLNNAVGAIMFMNTKSASLQILSMLNYVNHQENNPLSVAKAVLNLKQYSKDIYTILSSPKLKRRFAGEGRGINEAEIASAISSSTNKASALLAYLLKVGFTPTRAADAAAIGLGGAPYYRNNIIAFQKQGFSKEEAEAKAWEKFSETTEKFQQSSDPMLISMQQAGVLGRFILAFQNTPMQYTRSMVKDGTDFIKRRRIEGLTQSESDKVYISRMIYYGTVQNFMFAALSNTLFALIPGFDDDDEELDATQQKLRTKQVRIINNMLDMVLRGSGIYGAIVSTLKNVTMRYYKEEKKDPFSKDHRNTIIEILNLSPPIGSKIKKINDALKIKEWDKDIIEKRGWDVSINGKVNLSPSYSVLGNFVEGATNIPLARMVNEVNRLTEMLDNRNSSLQRIALGLGWRTWDVHADNEEHDLIELEAKQDKKAAQKQKVIDAREEKKRLAEEARFKGMSDDEIALTKRKDIIYKTTSKNQKDKLLDLGLTIKEIKALKYEKDRVNKIIELQNKK